MWEFNSSWPTELNEMTLAAGLLACAHHIRTYQTDPKDPDRNWHREHAEDGLARLDQDQEILPEGELVDLTRRLQAFRSALVAIPEALLAAVEQRSKDVLLANLEEAPGTREAYRRRLEVLTRLPWLGRHAGSIPRGWVPLFEKTARLLITAAAETDSARWVTEELKEKYGTLRWYVLGDELFDQAAFLAEEMSEFCCLACGREATTDGDGDDNGLGWLLNLCEEHRKLRASSSRELSALMYDT